MRKKGAKALGRQQIRLVYGRWAAEARMAVPTDRAKKVTKGKFAKYQHSKRDSSGVEMESSSRAGVEIESGVGVERVAEYVLEDSMALNKAIMSGAEKVVGANMAVTGGENCVLLEVQTRKTGLLNAVENTVVEYDKIISALNKLKCMETEQAALTTVRPFDQDLEEVDVEIGAILDFIEPWKELYHNKKKICGKESGEVVAFIAADVFAMLSITDIEFDLRFTLSQGLKEFWRRYNLTQNIKE
ncbi:hypothetical protein XELAEV_18028280mg [Xenopus laevis]|uniref:Uncharacterized protein n=1 Tax=Xenopus laevis TaxID=8355 RepID=A0A974CWU7_XENLA|nr:hypothetical protein XELAEV_18028280mg [Xenopus laevis]